MQEVRESTGTHFRVVVPKREGTPGQPRDIMFQPVPQAEIPRHVAELQIEIERTLTTLNMLFPLTRGGASRKPHDRDNNEKFDLYFEKLVGIAILGIGQDQPVFGKMSLDNLKEEIRLRESGRVKNAYVRRLGIWALTFILAFALLYLVARAGWFPDWIGVKREFVTLLAGSFLGTWLSFAIRKVELRFSELSIVENDQLDPPIRLVFVAGLTMVVGLIFSTKMATITIGGFDTHFLNSGTHALLIGLFCGIAEQGLATTVGARAGDFIGRIGDAGRQSGANGGRQGGAAVDENKPSRTKKPGEQDGQPREDDTSEPSGASADTAAGAQPTHGQRKAADPARKDDVKPAG